MDAHVLIEKICAAVELLIQAGKPHEGLFPSILDLDTGEMLETLPDPIPGQRMGDRAFPGSNLIHDEAVLKTMYGLAAALDRPEYAKAADRYLERFATHCTDTASGLFPWGEHSFWHLGEDRVGNGYIDVAHPERPWRDAIHDHLRQAPLWLWEKLWVSSPRCVERFAEGLDYHYTAGDGPPEYIRHAPITSTKRLTRGDRSCDFPRHGGFYIFDWAYAYLKTGRNAFLQQIRDMMDYWWEKRDNAGVCLIESRTEPPRRDDQGNVILSNSASQTMSLATSLLETAALIEEEEPELAGEMRVRAATYTEGFFGAPHDLEQGVFCMSYNQLNGELVFASPVWGSEYGHWPASYMGLYVLCAYRFNGDPRCLEWAEAVGRQYLLQPLPQGLAAPAMDAGMALDLLVALYEVTDDQGWLEGAGRLAEAMVDVYFDHPLPRGAAGIDWYESQMGPSFLLHGLARWALMTQEPGDCPLTADYTGR